VRALLLASFLVGCGSVEQGRVEYRAPDRATFPAVAEAIAPHCATLDCHGQAGRNFRFYWSRGLRLSPEARPGDQDTTEAEYTETYRSLVGLEPLKLDAVLAGALPPGRLSVLRKARGDEAHKGGVLWAAGSDPDRCLVSWLVGTMDSDACKRATAP
jgi:hypothetical protein